MRSITAIVRGLFTDERVRFLAVGAVNTAIGYLLFVAIELAVGRYTSYFVSLYAAYVIAAVFAFMLHRRFTFRVHGTGNVIVDLIRFQAVGVVALAVNTVALPALVELAKIPPIPAQLIIVVITTLISYVGHKFFSFRRRKPPVDIPTGPVETNSGP